MTYVAYNIIYSIYKMGYLLIRYINRTLYIDYIDCLLIAYWYIQFLVRPLGTDIAPNLPRNHPQGCESLRCTGWSHCGSKNAAKCALPMAQTKCEIMYSTRKNTYFTRKFNIIAPNKYLFDTYFNMTFYILYTCWISNIISYLLNINLFTSYLNSFEKNNLSVSGCCFWKI